ncbi:hypothetical protein Nepgr_010015 [Nepenthes gracilis]|uniref:Uncharacterized protein n=1 Tax=Nepenthes gracilis TaxID=150966 RepID=A0AAD3XKX7_NEPGR|nr:hypothetical protein Nepgr_010015 [Nepenthes gracilis]
MMVPSNSSGDLSEEMEGDAFRQLIPLLLFEPRLANLYSLVQDPSDKPIGIVGAVSFVEASAIVNICCTVSDDGKETR